MLTAIIVLLVIHIIQTDARLWQVTNEIRKLREDLAKKP